MPQRVQIYEVGARDGLQNEPTRLSPAQRIAFVNLLSETGAAAVEAAAFVNPKRVPQMDGASEVMRGVQRSPGVAYPGKLKHAQHPWTCASVTRHRICVPVCASARAKRQGPRRCRPCGSTERRCDGRRLRDLFVE